jgi:hypothetical protein
VNTTLNLADQKLSLGSLSNEATPRGLHKMTSPEFRPAFRTDAVSLARLRIASIDNIAEAIALANGRKNRVISGLI